MPLTFEEFTQLRRQGMPDAVIDRIGAVAPEDRSRAYFEAIQETPLAGPPEAALVEEDPIGFLLQLIPGVGAGVRVGRAVPGAFRAVGRGLQTKGGGLLGKFLARRVPGVGSAMDAAELAQALTGGGPAARVAPGAGKAIAARLRAVASAPSASLPAARAAARPVAEAAGEMGPRGTKEFAAYARRRAMALMDEAGFPKAVDESRKAVSEIIGREVKSRSSLTPDEWFKVMDAANERIMQQAARQAAQKAAETAGRKAARSLPKLRVVPRAAPTGSAARAARVKVARGPRPMQGASKPELARRAAARKVAAERAQPAPAGPAPTELETLLGQSLEARQAMTAAGLSPTEMAFVLRKLAGGM